MTLNKARNNSIEKLLRKKCGKSSKSLITRTPNSKILNKDLKKSTKNQINNKMCLKMIKKGIVS